MGPPCYLHIGHLSGTCAAFSQHVCVLAGTELDEFAEPSHRVLSSIQRILRHHYKRYLYIQRERNSSTTKSRRRADTHTVSSSVTRRRDELRNAPSTSRGRASNCRHLVRDNVLRACVIREFPEQTSCVAVVAPIATVFRTVGVRHHAPRRARVIRSRSCI